MYVEYVKGAKYALPDADISDDVTYFKDAGYVLEDNDLVLDIDHLPKESIKALISEYSIKTRVVWTDRGAHLYFRKPQYFRTGTRVCALGFEVEFKTKRTNQSVTIKRNGVLREIENDNLRQELPTIFRLNKKFKDLVGLGEGEGRNNALRDHRVLLDDYDDFDKAIRFINKYVFSESLSDKELESTILREDFKVSIGSSEYDVATVLIKEHKIKPFLSQLYFYDGVKYVNDDNELRKIIYARVGNVKTKIIDEIFKQIQYRANSINIETMPIKFKNGILKNGAFIEGNFSEFTLYYIDIDYDKNAKAVDFVDNYLDHLTEKDEDYKKIILEVLAHCLITDKEMKRALSKFFFFIGSGGNGKGTLLEVIRNILQPQNCSTSSIKQLEDDRFLPSLIGKLANLGDDVEDGYINDKSMKILKNISTCDTIETRKLYKQSESSAITTSLIFTSNHLLKTYEKGDSYKRRVLWLPMFGKVEKKDPKFITKLTTPEALSYWIRLTIEAYFRLYENNKFSSSEKVEEWNRQYHQENDLADMFLGDYNWEDIENKKPKDVFDKYLVWCEDNDEKANKKNLIDAIQAKFGLIVKPTKIGGRTMRVFRKS